MVQCTRTWARQRDRSMVHGVLYACGDEMSTLDGHLARDIWAQRHTRILVLHSSSQTLLLDDFLSSVVVCWGEPARADSNGRPFSDVRGAFAGAAKTGTSDSVDPA